MTKNKRTKETQTEVQENVIPIKILRKNRKKVFSPQNKSQETFVNAIQTKDVVFNIGSAGSGKAQPLDSIVYTPNGPKTMGSLKVGDEVLTPDGGKSKITKVFPQGEKDVYRLVFKNGDTVECCADHLWKVSAKSTFKWENKIVDTKYLINNIKTKKGRRRFSIKSTLPVNFTEKELRIDPYLMGVILGDGGISQGTIIISNEDSYVITKVLNVLNNNYKLNKKSKFDYSLTKINRSNNQFNKDPHMYIDVLKKCGLWGLKSVDKFIPDEYKYNSIENRLELIRGLMDTDGTVNKPSGMPIFNTSSKKLMNDVKEVIESLGGICYVTKKNKKYSYKGETKIGLPSYEIYISYKNGKDLFGLDRKKKITKERTKYTTDRFLEKVEFVGKKECQCIMIKDVNHLYLTNNFIPTHNTTIAVAWAFESVIDRKYKKLILARPAIEACGEKIGFLPGEIESKFQPYMQPVYDVLSEYGITKKDVAHLIEEEYIEICPLAYMRGRSLKNCVLIVEEAQNMSSAQMEMLLTRMGSGSKLIVTGDITQRDIKNAVGIEEAYKLFKDDPSMEFIWFPKEETLRSALVQRVVEKYETLRNEKI